MTVFDVAQYILEKVGCTSTWKLQKLVYYSQAWNLVWKDSHLFREEIEAWANGPVCPELYNKHRGQFSIDRIIDGDSSRLTADQKHTIDTIVEFYGKYSGQQLSDLTHSEKPWIDARSGLSLTERGNRTISLESMSEYYSSL